jgi:hypothetical protein
MNWLLRVFLVLINANGVFKQLSAAHLDPHVEKLVTISKKAAECDAKSAPQEQLIADDDRQIVQIDTAIEEAEKRGRSTSAMDLACGQGQRREVLAGGCSIRQLVLVGLETERSEVACISRRRVGRHSSPRIRRLAGLRRSRARVQILVLAMVLTCDPLSLGTCGLQPKRRIDAEKVNAIHLHETIERGNYFLGLRYLSM